MCILIQTYVNVKKLVFDDYSFEQEKKLTITELNHK
jgi:hypothetical protein